MARRNMDRVMESFYIGRAQKAEVETLAEQLGQSKADTYRQLLSIGLQHAPTKRAKPVKADRAGG